MEGVYTGCLIFGILYVTVAILLGDLIGTSLHHVFHALPDVVQPVTLVGGITAFGGAGLVLATYTTLSPGAIAACSAAAAVLLSVLTHFIYVKPMARAENSVAYSIRRLGGKLGDVTIPIPQGGFGEVHIASVHGAVHEIAGSFDGSEIAVGTKVVVVEERGNVLYVTPFEERSG